MINILEQSHTYNSDSGIINRGFVLSMLASSDYILLYMLRQGVYRTFQTLEGLTFESGLRKP